jgi:hypothetical protein
MAVLANQAPFLARAGTLGAVTGVTAETVLYTLAVPPMGPNDALRVRWSIDTNSNANSKTISWRMTDISGAVIVSAAITNRSYSGMVAIANAGSVSSQIGCQGSASLSGTGTGPTLLPTATVDTSAGFNFVITTANANIGDTVTLRVIEASIIKGD